MKISFSVLFVSILLIASLMSGCHALQFKGWEYDDWGSEFDWDTEYNVDSEYDGSGSGTELLTATATTEPTSSAEPTSSSTEVTTTSQPTTTSSASVASSSSLVPSSSSSAVITPEQSSEPKEFPGSGSLVYPTVTATVAAALAFVVAVF